MKLFLPPKNNIGIDKVEEITKVIFKTTYNAVPTSFELIDFK